MGSTFQASASGFNLFLLFCDLWSSFSRCDFFGEFRTSKNYLLVPLSFLILGCSIIFLPVFEILLVVNLNNPRDIPQSIIKIRNRLVQKRESKTYGCIQGSWNNGNASKAKRNTSDLWTSVWTLAAGLGSMQ